MGSKIFCGFRKASLKVILAYQQGKENKNVIFSLELEEEKATKDQVHEHLKKKIQCLDIPRISSALVSRCWTYFPFWSWNLPQVGSLNSSSFRSRSL